MTAGDWRTGLAWLAGVLVLLFFGLGLLDAYFELRGWEPVGDRLQRWTRRYPVYAAGLILVWGALLGHLFLNRGF